MSYTTAVFDLDGTLLDTLDDLADSVNAALAAFGLPTRTREEVRCFVGNGVEILMERAIPDGKQNPRFAACLATFKQIYSQNCTRKTAPYPGILTLLEHLRDRGIKTAIVSNKFDSAVKALNTAYFGDRIPVAVGEREADGVRKKPAPDTVLEALRLLGADPASAVYVGDSYVDIATARNANLPCISVTWGFRDRAFLTDHGATAFANTAEELEHMICSE